MSLNNLSATNISGALIDAGDFVINKRLVSNNQILYYTDPVTSIKTGYVWKGTLPHITSTNNPNTDGGISDTSWVPVIYSKLKEKMETEGLTLDWNAHLPTVEVAYGLTKNSLKMWKSGTTATSDDYWLYTDGTVWNGVGVLGSTPETSTGFEKITPNFNASIKTYSASATDGQTDFNIPFTFSTITVFVNGSIQLPGLNYAVSGSTLTFTTELEAGDLLYVFIGNPNISTNDKLNRIYTANAMQGQTTIQVPYDFSTAIVYINGVLQNPSTAYSVGADRVITFSEELYQDDEIIIMLGDIVVQSDDYVLKNDLLSYDASKNINTNNGTSVQQNIDIFSNFNNSFSNDDGLSNINYKSSMFSNNYKSTLYDLYQNKLSLFEFIPPELHDGIRNYTYEGDLSVYIQNAINQANSLGGAVIECPPGQYYCNIVTKQYVVLIGSRNGSVRRSLPWTYGTPGNPSRPYGTRFRNFSNDWIIKSETNSQNDVSSRSFGIIGIDFDATDAINSTGGVRLRGPEFCVKSCSFYGFQDQGLEVSGNIGLIEDVIANECLKNRIRTDYVGTIEISGASDCQIHRIEGNAQVKGLNSITNSSPYICGIKISGNNHYISGLMGEISETGIYISASSVHHKISDSRADNNVGPGYLLNGVQMVNCHSYNNSRTGDGLYPAFGALDSASRLLLSNCLAWTDNAPVDGTGTQRLHSYGFDFSNVDYLSLRLKPWINQCFSYGDKNGWINSPLTYGVEYTPTNGLLTISSNATTTPNVDGVSVISISTTSLSQITGFVGGMIGQEVDVYLNATASVTLVNSSTFLINNFAKNSNKTMVVGRVYKFIKTSATIWREVGDVVRVYSGTTAERPSTAATTGMQYFDTTINKPIWRNADNTGWVDSSGTSV
ncbi:hypothetical protein DIDNDMLP_00443 [Klebsiella phage KP13-7]|nr:hypothetical protein DIDNDMLP_00443 [Klebsiella phage KP13-7]